jgi:hypothetical protein
MYGYELEAVRMRMISYKPCNVRSSNVSLTNNCLT